MRTHIIESLIEHDRICNVILKSWQCVLSVGLNSGSIDHWFEPWAERTLLETLEHFFFFGLLVFFLLVLSREWDDWWWKVMIVNSSYGSFPPFPPFPTKHQKVFGCFNSYRIAQFVLSGLTAKNCLPCPRLSVASAVEQEVRPLRYLHPLLHLHRW